MDDSGQTAESYVSISLVDTNLKPTAQFALANQSLELPTPVLFSAEDSSDPDGSIISYEWDFDGDGSFEFSSPGYLCTHVYNQDCTVTASLRVTDNNGGQDVCTQVASIGIGKTEAGFAPHFVCQTQPWLSYRACLSSVAGKPAFLIWGLNALGNVSYYYSTAAEPVLAADWYTRSVFYGLPACAVLQNVSNRPLALVSSDSGELVCTHAGGPLGEWYAHSVESSGVTGDVSLALMYSGVGICYGKSDLMFAYSPTPLPDAPADWYYCAVGTTGPVGEYLDLTLLGNSPQICFSSGSGPQRQLSYARATAPQPQDSSDWIWYPLLPAGSDGSMQIETLANRPAILFTEQSGLLRLAGAQNAQPAGPGNWQAHSISFASPAGCSLGLEAGLPLAAYNALSPAGPQLATGKIPAPEASSDWTLRNLYGPDVTLLDASTVGGRLALLLRQSSGRVYYCVQQAE